MRFVQFKAIGLFLNNVTGKISVYTFLPEYRSALATYAAFLLVGIFEEKL